MRTISSRSEDCVAHMERRIWGGAQGRLDQRIWGVILVVESLYGRSLKSLDIHPQNLYNLQVFFVSVVASVEIARGRKGLSLVT